MRVSLTTAAAILIALATPSFAQDKIADCAWVTNDAQRLNCYDAAALLNQVPDLPTREPEHLEFFRDSYAQQWDRYFRRLRASVTVYAVQDGAARATLTFSGPLGDQDVIDLITKSRLLERTKEIGFTAVEFVTKGRSERITFDLSSPSRCDSTKRICF